MFWLVFFFFFPLLSCTRRGWLDRLALAKLPAPGGSCQAPVEFPLCSASGFGEWNSRLAAAVLRTRLQQRGKLHIVLCGTQTDKAIWPKSQALVNEKVEI